MTRVVDSGPPAPANPSEKCRMPVNQAPLFKLMSARLTWLSQREVVLGENLANADTPDYRPRDLRPKEFARVVQSLPGAGSRLAMTRTDAAHIDGGEQVRLGLGSHPAKTVYETTPNGNAVILEEQMAKASQTALDYQLTSNLYRKYLGMLRTALGTQS
jgi:flagellar basal-body rod protein FlgB